jgi:hypothetical protein
VVVIVLAALVAEGEEISIPMDESSTETTAPTTAIASASTATTG